MKLRFCQLFIIAAICSNTFPVLAKETINDITQLNPIVVDEVITPTSVEEISKRVANHNGSISIGGGRYSQGGQIATENCLFLDMRRLNRILTIDEKKRQITVEAGATWRQIIEALDAHALSLKNMQSFSNFTVGGSLSVNAHGRYVGEGALIHATESIKLVLPDGSVKTGSRVQNPELFFGAIGGYGGIGVIVEATFHLADNIPLRRSVQGMDVSAYKDYFLQNIRDSKTAVLHNANLYPPDYNQVIAIAWATTDKPVTMPARLAPNSSPSLFEKYAMLESSEGPFGKQARKYFSDPMFFTKNRVAWRNYEASYDVASLQPLSSDKYVYQLEEYFVPVEQFDSFVGLMSEILRKYHADILNISIRHAPPDKESLLSWAPKDEVFSFVLYFKRDRADDKAKDIRDWTDKLIDATLDSGGTYYLPYQIIASKEQFLKAYPRAPEFFALKKKVDPTYKFRNKLWDHYYSE